MVSKSRTKRWTLDKAIYSGWKFFQNQCLKEVQYPKGMMVGSLKMEYYVEATDSPCLIIRATVTSHRDAYFQAFSVIQHFYDTMIFFHHIRSMLINNTVHQMATTILLVSYFSSVLVCLAAALANEVATCRCHFALPEGRVGVLAIC